MLRFVNEVPGSAFARQAIVEGTGIEHDALAQALDDAEAVVIDRALEDAHHMSDLHGVRAGDEGRAAGEQLLHRIDRTVEAALRIGLRLATRRRGGAGLVLGQAVNKIVHDDIGQTDVLARGVVQMIAANGEAVTVATEDEHMHIRAAQRNARGQRQGATVNEVNAVAVDEIREARGATDASDADDLLMRILQLFQHLVEGGEHGEVTTAGAPRGVVGGEDFLGELLGGRSLRGSKGGRHDYWK